MLQQALKYFTNIELTQAAMILFFLTFLALSIAAMKKSNTKHFTAMAELPFAKENKNE